MSSKKKYITISIDISVDEKLKDEAKKSNRTKSAMANLIFVERYRDLFTQVEGKEQMRHAE